MNVLVGKAKEEDEELYNGQEAGSYGATEAAYHVLLLYMLLYVIQITISR